MTHPTDFMLRGLPLPLQKLRSGANIAPHGVMTICPTQQSLGLTVDNHNESPPALPPVPLEDQLTPVMMQWQAAHRPPETKWSSDSSSSRGSSVNSDLPHCFWDCLSCLDTMRMVHKKYRKGVRAPCRLSKGMDWTDA